MTALSSMPANLSELRPLLHRCLDEASEEELKAVHRLLLELQLDEVAERLDAGFDADRNAGKLSRVPELIRAARDSLRSRAHA